MRARKEVSSPIILPAALKRRSTPAEVIFYKYFYKYRIYISIILSVSIKNISFLAKLVRRRKVSISKLRFESSPKKLRGQKFECLKGPFTAILLFSGENRLRKGKRKELLKIFGEKFKCGRQIYIYVHVQLHG